jgi:hypothetical protein
MIALAKCPITQVKPAAEARLNALNYLYLECVMNICACQTLHLDRSMSYAAPSAAPIAQLVALANRPELPPALTIEGLDHLPPAATQTLADLNTLTQTLDQLVTRSTDAAVQKAAQRWQRCLLAEIKQRQSRFDHWQARLTDRLPPIKALNPVIYAKELATIDLEQLLEQVLDGNETALQSALLQWCDRMSTAHADFKLHRLALISCLVKTAGHKVSRTKLACRWFPVLGSGVAASLLQLSMDWGWTLGVTGLLVMPLMLWMTRSMRQEMQTIAQQEWQDWQIRLQVEFERLNDQEAQVQRLCDCLVNSEATAGSSTELTLRLPEPSL